MAIPSSDTKITPFRNDRPVEGSRDAPLRALPHNIEAEQGLLGSLLRNNRAYEKVAEFLRPDHFANIVHGRIYEALGRLIDRGQIADPVTLRNVFEHDDGLAEAGGAAYLNQLVDALATTVNVEDYGRLIHDLAVRRELIALGSDMVEQAYSVKIDPPAPAQIEMAEQKLYSLATLGASKNEFQSFEKAIATAIATAEAAYKRDSHIVGITTGFRELDRKLGGVHPSDLIILAGRPGMGKTALATNIAYNAADAARKAQETGAYTSGAVVGFFSLEMSAEQLATRILSDSAQISSDRIRRGDIGQEAFDRIVAASQTLSRLPLFIDDTPALSVSALRTRARRLKRQHNLGLIVIDYLQLLQSTPGARPENRVQELSEITRGLKTLAKELSVPVIALSQLSRQVESREDKHPQLSDLRESGSIEQDADVVMFIYREEYYLRLKEPQLNTPEREAWDSKLERARNRAEISVAKQRHGPTGPVDLHFEGEFTRFSDLIEDNRLPERRS